MLTLLTMDCGTVFILRSQLWIKLDQHGDYVFIRRVRKLRTGKYLQYGHDEQIRGDRVGWPFASPHTVELTYQ